MAAKFAIMQSMKTKNRKTLAAIFETPTRSNIVFADVEALVMSLPDGDVFEREGSRVKLVIGGCIWRCHRPHPGKEAKKYQVEEARCFLESAGVTPARIEAEEAEAKGKRP
jgi:hypothetical protein